MECLKISGLKKSFGDKDVLKGIDMSVPEGSVFGFVGRNGAGKTTTMKAILGLLRVDEGEIFVQGKRVRFGQTETNRFIGYLPDVPEFYSFMTAREYLNLCGQSLKMKDADINKRSDELLALVGLEGENHRIKGYSRGMKQRLGIAQALLGSPKLLICDEPTSALDPIGRREILDILSSVKGETTVLFSTHILTDIERICTDVAFIKDGKIAKQGRVSDMKALGRGEDILVEVSSESEINALLLEFSNCRKSKELEVILSGEDGTMKRLLEFVSQNRIDIRRIQRVEPSLENLFEEVFEV